MNIAVIYHSVTGTTAALAEHIAQGIDSVDDANALSIAINDEDIEAGRYANSAVLEQLTNCQGIVFGSPTYMGSVTAQYKSFLDASSEIWYEQQWRNKVAAGFTIGANASGDQLSTMQYLQAFAAQHSMLWCSLDIVSIKGAEGLNRLGAHSGLICLADGAKVCDDDLLTARHFGQRVALVSNQFNAGESVTSTL